MSVTIFEAAERLFELEPAETYVTRSIATIVSVTGAKGVRLRRDGRDVHAERAGVGDGMTLVLKTAQGPLGTLHLYAADGTGHFAEEANRHARWLTKLFSHGVAVLPRLAKAKGEVDVKALLDATPLTARERDVVGRLIAGASTRDIAEETQLTISTVNTYMKRIFAKLGVHSRVELLARVNRTHASMRNAAE